MGESEYTKEFPKRYPAPKLPASTALLKELWELEGYRGIALLTGLGLDTMGEAQRWLDFYGFVLSHHRNGRYKAGPCVQCFEPQPRDQLTKARRCLKCEEELTAPDPELMAERRASLARQAEREREYQHRQPLTVMGGGPNHIRKAGRYL